MQKMC